MKKTYGLPSNLSLYEENLSLVKKTFPLVKKTYGFPIKPFPLYFVRFPPLILSANAK